MPLISNVNIKELPVIEEVTSTDLLLVETQAGTQTISFDNFVVGPENVTFFNEIVSLSSQAISLSASLINYSNSLSAAVDDLVLSRINSLSATVNQTYKKIFYQAGELNIASGNTVSDSIAIIVPTGVILDVTDIALTFGSTVIPAFSGLLINPYPSLYGSAPNYTLQVNITSPSVTNAVVYYNINKPY